MLKLVADDGNPRSALSVEDLPLGPWAGAILRVWATKTGTRWHADPDCPSLKSRARSDEFAQPSSGTLGDRILPEGLHCDPPGTLTDYLNAARHLVYYANETREAERKRTRGDLPISALGRHLGGFGNVDKLLAKEPLASISGPEHDRRSRLADDVNRYLSADSERACVMVLADWVRRGRTPRGHQQHYDRFVGAAVTVFNAAGLTSNLGMHYAVNRDPLPEWLESVAGGSTCESATQAVADKELAYAQRGRPADESNISKLVHETWLATGARWQLMLESMALAHPGKVLALFKRHGSGLDTDLLDVLARTGPSATLKIAHLDWTVAELPAACRLSFASNDDGSGGVILLEEPGHQVTHETCELFLRNLAHSLGYPDLTQHVRRGTAALDHTPRTKATDHEYDLSAAVQRRGFSSSPSGDGISADTCRPALLAALEGDELVRPSAGRKRRSRT